MKIGDYVRTESGKIGKILDFCKCEKCKKRGFYEPILDTSEFYITNLDKECNFEGLKFSKNIIDLIEVGDYVNGEEVIGFSTIQNIEYEKPKRIALTLSQTISCLPEDIKSIVTKEQFEGMEYRI